MIGRFLTRPSAPSTSARRGFLSRDDDLQIWCRRPLAFSRVGGGARADGRERSQIRDQGPCISVIEPAGAHRLFLPRGLLRAQRAGRGTDGRDESRYGASRQRP
jgi:hypothetical protein